MSRERFRQSISEEEQHSPEGIDMGIAPEVIGQRHKMWSNVRSDLRRQVQQKFSESLDAYEGKEYTYQSNLRVKTEVKRRLKNGEFNDLREKVMYESWDLLESALDVEKMTPMQVENMLDKFVADAQKVQGEAKSPEQTVREKELQKQKEAYELAEKAKEVFGRLPEEPTMSETPAGKMTPQEERAFATWVTEKMNAGESLPDDPAERLRQYGTERGTREPAA